MSYEAILLTVTVVGAIVNIANLTLIFLMTREE